MMVPRAAPGFQQYSHATQAGWEPGAEWAEVRGTGSHVKVRPKRAGYAAPLDQDHRGPQPAPDKPSLESQGSLGDGDHSLLHMPTARTVTATSQALSIAGQWSGRKCSPL